MNRKKTLFFHLGLLTMVAAIAFGAITYYHSETQIEEVTHRTQVDETVQYHVVRAGMTTFPLRNYSFLTFALLPIGLVMMYRSYPIKTAWNTKSVGKFTSGALIGFGSALAISVFTAWTFLVECVDSGYLVVTEAKVMMWGELAANFGVGLGIALIIVAFGIELLARRNRKSR